MSLIMYYFKKFWLKERIRLSNYYSKKDPTTVIDMSVDYIDRCKTLADVKVFAKRLYKNFKWTQDSACYLFDYMRTPAETYRDFHTNGTLYDDCDGFAGAMYHVLKENFETYVVTCMTTPISQSHTLVLFKYKTTWYVVDYDVVALGGNTIEDAMSVIQSRMNTQIDCYNLCYFDTSEGIWKIK